MDRQPAFARVRGRTQRIISTWVCAAVIGGMAACNFPPPARVETLTPEATQTAPPPTAAPSPTPTQIPTVTTAPTPVITPFVDGINDGIDCRTGASQVGFVPLEVDIASAWAVRTTGPAPDINFYVQYSDAVDLAETIQADNLDFLGGIELWTPGGAEPLHDPEWYFNYTGNLSYNFGWNKDVQALFAWRTVYQGDDWQVFDEVFYPAELEGNVLKISVPAAQIPAGSTWMAVSTNFMYCDAAGLRDGRPSLPLP